MSKNHDALREALELLRIFKNNLGPDRASLSVEDAILWDRAEALSKPMPEGAAQGKPSRIAFEHHWQKTRGGKKARNELQRHPLQPQTYVNDSANRHWVTWQAAQAAMISASPAAPEGAKPLPTMVDKKSTNPQPQVQGEPRRFESGEQTTIRRLESALASKEDEFQRLYAHSLAYREAIAQHRAALEECVEALEESWRTEKGDAAILLAQKTLRKESMHAPDVCKKDAERYRWLASQAFVNLSEWCHTYHLAQKAGGLTPYVDAAITQANEVLGRKEGGV